MRWVRNDIPHLLDRLERRKSNNMGERIKGLVAKEGQDIALEQWRGSAMVYSESTKSGVNIVAEDISEKPHIAYMEFGIGVKGMGTYPGDIPNKGVPKTGAWMYHYPSEKKILTKRGKRGWILRLDNGAKPLYRFFQGYAAKAPMYHAGEYIKEYINEQLVIDLNRGDE